MPTFLLLVLAVAALEFWAVQTWNAPRRRAHSIVRSPAQRPARPAPEMFQRSWRIVGPDPGAPVRAGSVLPTFKVYVPMPKGTKPPRPPCTCSKR